MRTTITLDDKLVERAMQYTGITERTALIRAGLEQLIQRELANRLIALGGTMPTLEIPPRRRPAVDDSSSGI
jgi:Arc/MetJ family transcription regulator